MKGSGLTDGGTAGFSELCAQFMKGILPADNPIPLLPVRYVENMIVLAVTLTGLFSII